MTKFLTNDLKRCQRVDNSNTWVFEICSYNKETNQVLKKIQIKFDKVHVEGFIDTVFNENVGLLRDSTGKVKLSQCNNHNGSNKIIKGAYMSAIGSLVQEKGMPEIVVTQLRQLENDYDLYYKLWPLEIRDFQLFKLGHIQHEM